MEAEGARAWSEFPLQAGVDDLLGAFGKGGSAGKAPFGAPPPDETGPAGDCGASQPEGVTGHKEDDLGPDDLERFLQEANARKRKRGAGEGA